MREIKFRAWDKLDEEMVSWEDFNEKWIRQPLKSLASLFPYEHLEWMQYTGLKDKNGVEIYEGDIVKAPYFDKNLKLDYWVAEVKFADGSFFYMGDVPYSAFGWDSKTFEVIGNIYENPELLK